MARKSRQGFALKGFFYSLRYRVGEYALRGFVAMLPWIPERLFRLLTSAAARMTFFLLWKYRKRMEENLAMAMGAEFPTREQRMAVVWKAWRNFSQGIYETTCALHSSKEAIVAQIGIEGEEHLRRSLAKGKGVIALSAHLGNFTMIGARLAAAGYAFSAVVKQPKDPRFAGLIDHYRAMVGVETISAKPRREAARQILRTLRRNAVILVIADEFKSGDVEVEFLGRSAPAPRGPATLALRTGAAVLPTFVTRDAEDRLMLHIGAEIELIKTGDLQRDIAANAGLFTGHLELMVRRYPDQWNWLGFHRNGRTPRSQMGESKSAGIDPQGTVSS